MPTRDGIDSIRVIRVTKAGKEVGFSALGDKLASIQPNGFVAVDTEFSGLGTSPDLKHENLETRYAALRQLANTRAVFSVGVAIFDPVKPDANMADLNEKTPPEETKGSEEAERAEYEVAVFDLLMSCQSEFSLDANAGEFLTAHSFDFNEMFQKGIPYERASSEKSPEKGTEKGLPFRWGKLPRGLLWRIGRQAIPLVVHNGLFDLAFLFAAFQGPLPETLHGFISALLECVPAGYYDTKILATCAEERASFLGYLFAKAVLGEKIRVSTAKRLPSNDLTDPNEDLGKFALDALCALYAFRGFCPRGANCPFKHDPFMVISEEKEGKLPKDTKDAYKRHKLQTKQMKRQKAEATSQVSKMTKKQRSKLLNRKQEAEMTENGMINTNKAQPREDAIHCGGSDSQQQDIKSETENPSNLKHGHTAGWDAFCTGYVFAAYRLVLASDKLLKHRNRIALPYKQTSLLLCKSQFADLDMQKPSTTDISQDSTEISSV